MFAVLQTSSKASAGITLTVAVTNVSGPIRYTGPGIIYNGSINAAATGGIAPYTYSINSAVTAGIIRLDGRSYFR